MFWRQYRKDHAATVGLILLLLLILMAVFGPFLIQTDPLKQDLQLRRTTPSSESIFGRDQLGRDIFARIVHGARITIIAGLTATLIALVGGFTLGIISGYSGGTIDGVIMRIVDLMLSFPFFLFALVIIAILEPGLDKAIIAVGIAKIAIFARLVRGLTLKTRQEGYTEAALAVGASDFRIMRRHIMPNIIMATLVLATVELAGTVLSVAGLSFLGLGAQAPTPEWGLMLSDARSYLSQAPHIMFFPGLFLLLLVISINLIGDGLQFATDPKRRIS